MNIEEAQKLIQSKSQSAPFVIPSLKRRLLFRNIDTGSQKQLSGFAQAGMSRIDCYMMKLGMFDDLLVEDKHSVAATMLKLVDTISFTAQLKMSANNIKSCPALFPCSVCNDKNSQMQVRLDTIAENCEKYDFNSYSISMSDSDGREYRFVVHDPNWVDVLILLQSMRGIEGPMRESALGIFSYFSVNKVALYIKQFFIDGDEVKTASGESFCKGTVPERIKVFDALNPAFTIDTSSEKSLINLIAEKFSEVDINRIVFKDAFIGDVCATCSKKLGDVYTYDNFFML